MRSVSTLRSFVLLCAALGTACQSAPKAAAPQPEVIVPFPETVPPKYRALLEDFDNYEEVELGQCDDLGGVVQIQMMEDIAKLGVSQPRPLPAGCQALRTGTRSSFAVEKLHAFGTPGVDAVIACLESGSWDAKREMLYFLADSKDPRAYALIDARLAIPQLEAAALHALGFVGDRRALPKAEARLSSKNDDLQRAAVFTAARLGNAAPLMRIYRQLYFGHQRDAIRAFGMGGDPRAVPLLIETFRVALTDERISEDDARAAALAAETLGHLQGAEITAVLLEAFRPKVPERYLCEAASRGLINQGDAGLDALAPIALSDDSNRTVCSGEALGSLLGDDYAAKRAVAQDPKRHWLLRGKALLHLAHDPRGHDTDLALWALKHERSEVQRAGIHLAHVQQLRETSFALCALLSSGSAEVQADAKRTVDFLKLACVDE